MFITNKLSAAEDLFGLQLGKAESRVQIFFWSVYKNSAFQTLS